MKSLRSLVLLVAACGGNSATPDARVDAPSADSSSADAPTGCNLAAPFGAPARLTSIDTTEAEAGIWLSEDEKVAYVTAAHPASGLSAYQIFVTGRTQLTDTFGPLVAVPNVSANPGVNQFATMSADGLTLVFSSNRLVSTNTELYVATRPSTLIGFGTPQVLTALNSPQSDLASALSPDAQALYFSSNRSGTQDLYVATGGPSAFSVVSSSSPVAALNSSTANDDLPVITRDGLTMYFASDRTGTYSVFVAHRAATSDPFGAPTVVSELSVGGAVTGPSWISPDGCRLYGAGAIGTGGPSDFDVWVATKP